ncbi:MAG: MSMEG_1061 family FMN-dependent PPOX-type flavoprotein [Candidatus Binatia bacterium]
MADADANRITTTEELRAVIGEPSPATQIKVWPILEPPAREFIARSPFLVLSTADADGHQDVSPKGDVPGFVAAPDERTLLIPDRKGNKLIMGLQNILGNPHVGVLFLVPGTNETLRVNGRAELTRDPAVCERLAARGQPALLAIRVTVDECFFHCAKAFLRAELWKPASWPTGVRVSFGKMFAAKLGGDETMVQQIDAMIEDDYRSNL